MSRFSKNMKSNKKKRFPLFLSSIIVCNTAACAHQRTQRLAQALDFWKGKTPDQIVETWGAPSGHFVMKSGQAVFSYDMERLASRSVYYYYHPESYTSSYSCRINFITDKDQNTVATVNSYGDEDTCWQMLHQINESTLPDNAR